MSYDSSKRTTKADVTREFGEAVAAAKGLPGEGTLAQAGKEFAEAVQAAADLVVDTVKEDVAAVQRYFRTKLGYQLHDPDQDVHILPHVDTPAVETEWVKTQIAAGLVEETTAKVAEAAAAAAKAEAAKLATE